MALGSVDNRSEAGFDFVHDPDRQNLEEMVLSLVSSSEVAPDSRMDVDAPHPCLQWVVWDDVASLRVKKSRVVRSGPEVGKLVFTPKIANLCPIYKDAIESGRVVILLRNAGVRMIRRSGMFKPDVPKHALIFESYQKSVLQAKHLETDAASDDDIDATDKLVRCLVCGLSSRTFPCDGDGLL